MKPARFDYERPQNLSSALMLIAHHGSNARVIAGGQSLGPMLNLRLAQPDLLIDITGIAELTQVTQSPDAVVVGACVTHADIEDERVPDVTRGALPSIAHQIAYRAVRNRGTIGGSLAQADPAGDWISCLSAIGAAVMTRGPSGGRMVPVEDYMVRGYETVLAPDELIEAVRIPRFSEAARFGYYKVCRKTGEFADAIGAFFDDPARSVRRAVFGATHGRPIVVGETDGLIGGKPGHGVGSLVGTAAARILESAGLTDPIDQQIRITALRRAIGLAFST